MIMARKQVTKENYDITPKTQTEQALHDAISARVKELASAPLGPRSLLELERFATVAHAFCFPVSK